MKCGGDIDIGCDYENPVDSAKVKLIVILHGRYIINVQDYAECSNDYIMYNTVHAWYTAIIFLLIHNSFYPTTIALYFIQILQSLFL